MTNKAIKALIARSRSTSKVEYTKEEMLEMQRAAILSDPLIVEALKSLAKM